MMTKSLKAKDQEDRKRRDGIGNQKTYTKQESRDEEGRGRQKRREGNTAGNKRVRYKDNIKTGRVGTVEGQNETGKQGRGSNDEEKRRTPHRLKGVVIIKG